MKVLIRDRETDEVRGSINTRKKGKSYDEFIDKLHSDINTDRYWIDDSGSVPEVEDLYDLFSEYA